MSEMAVPSVDVVIPVYNAPVLTRRCIDSVVSCLGKSIEHIYIQDDASNTETREMLDSLRYEGVHVYHSYKNQGFGASVNDAISRSDASYVLVLNSDTEVSEDFLPRLCASLVADPQLAVIIPVSNDCDHYNYNLNRYLLQSGGYILTHRLAGYAFLIRRSVFQEVGGFDPVFGRGYYEDIDLGRRIDRHSWRMGVHPEALIYHKGGGSFGRGLAYRALKRRSRTLYFSRYPNAKRNVLLLSGNRLLTSFPSNLINAIDNVFREGGIVHWLSPEPATKIPCLHMLNSRANLSMAVKLMLLRGWLRLDRRVSVIWILPDAPQLLRMLFVLLGGMRGVEIVVWEGKP
jgi:GT2 family glycosyltransferase